MKKIYLLLFPLFLGLGSLHGQMIDGKFGNEWINYDQTYFKIMVAEDGVYRISNQTLINAGIPMASITGSQLRIFHFGAEIPIHTSSEGTFGNADFVEFYGQKNRGDLDQYLFENPAEQMLNPDYSLYSDTSTYFLTWTNSGTGRRYTNVANDLNNLPAKESHFRFQQFYEHNEDREHIKRFLNTDGGAFSTYENGEGFSFGILNKQTLEIEPEAVATTIDKSELRVRFTTGIGIHHQIITINGNEVFNEENLPSYNVKDLTFDLSTSVISNKATVDFEGLLSLNDKIAIGRMSLDYPRLFDFGGKNIFHFTIEGNGNRKYIEIENFDAAEQNPILYNLSTNERMLVDLSDNLVKVALPGSSDNIDLVLTNPDTGIKNIDNIAPANFIDYTEQEVEYLIISNERLYNDGQGNNRVQEYANYRSSVNGGGYTSGIVEIQQLYDQYAYGVKYHPLSIRGFAQQINAEWETLKYILLIGKAREYHLVRSVQEQSDAQSTYFLPTYGYPGADNLLLADVGHNYPIVPFGRIATTNTDDIRIYLDKVKTLEENQRNSSQTIEDRAWMKNILHLGGGGTIERDLIKSHLADMEQVIENNLFGADVSSVFKTSSDPVQISKSEEIFNIINEGVSMITFFGHSGVGTFDFDIDNPENYDNFAKYPLMFSLGCYSGNIHTSTRGISERFVYYEDKGAIAFGATTGLGYVGPLHQFTKELYRLAGTSLYGKGMGDIFRQTIVNFDDTNTTTMETLIQQFTLQGDPAVTLNPSPGPDYVIDVASVNFEPRVVNAQQDSFQIVLDIVNLGFGIEETLSVELIQEFPDGEQVVVQDIKIQAPLNRNTVSLSIPNQGKKSIGLNRFLVTLDKENAIAEFPDPSAEMNNQLRKSNGELGISLFIIDDTAQPVSPLNFSIVDAAPTLMATTIDALNKEKKYLLEIDTTEFFNSPIKSRQEIIQEGGVLKWKPNVNYVPNTVYYWRVSPDSTIADIGFNWSGSSFTYLPEIEEGWNQQHYYQYLKDDFTFLDLEAQNQRFVFGDENRDFRLKNKIFTTNDRPGYWINGGEQPSNYFPWAVNEGVSITVIDPADLKSWKNSGTGLYNSINNNTTNRTFSYPTSTLEEREHVMNFLENDIPDGYYVVFWTLQRLNTSDYLPEEWAADSITVGQNIYTILEDQGANLVRQMATKGPLPYGLLYQKNVGALRESIGEDIESTISFDWSLTRPLSEGSFRSTLVGPVKKWERFEHLISEFSAADGDSIHFNIYGLNATQSDTTLLFENVSTSSVDLTTVNAIQYPYLQLEYYATDSDNRTAPQLDYWRIFFEGLPEAGVNASNFFRFYNDTIQQGDQLYFEIAIENLSQHPMDSLLVKYTLTDEQNNEITHFDRISDLKEEDVIRSTFEVNTKNISNKQRLTLEVNPNDDQSELFHFNNFAVKDFFIEQDQRNPVMDVTFDGLYIMNGDIVSSTPTISISLKDENRFLELGDTSLFKIFIKYPNQELGQRINFDDERIDFFPAASGDLERKNEAFVELRPTFLEDGTYELIVQSEDATGNQSGDIDYKVLFEVINKQAISRVLNYPNPFSTSTQFVYTLTGNTTPDYFKIQIMTVAGKIVREITQDEIGPLKIGTHRTDYTWDGTDEYGGRLANGVYLYRVIAKDAEGLEFDRHETNTNQFFKKEFGKMVILR